MTAAAGPSPLAGARSFLFTPASSERMLAKLPGSNADVVVVDLEDGVAADRKQAAREGYRAAYAELCQAPAVLAVRINGGDSPEHGADLELLAAAPPAAVVIPKATPDSVREAAAIGLPLIAAVETAASVLAAAEIAAAEAVAALTIGAADLGQELGLEDRPDRQQLLGVRSAIVLASAAAGLRRPIDAVFMDVGDTSGLEDECGYARALGFGAKAAIHPAQVDPINAAFAPTAEQLEWARRVVSAYEEATSAGSGAVSVDGELVDLPVVRRARDLLALASPQESVVS
ncbi:MAG: CoA ester lyase [Actinobacteria bacterium]|nr:CoA ester lyase [Actinomycetota bacterium]